MRPFRSAIGVPAAVLLSVSLVTMGLTGTLAPALTSPVSLVVMARPGAEASAAAAVKRVGGRITQQLNLVNGFAASVPSWAEGQVAANPAVLSATPDQSLQLMDATTSSSATGGLGGGGGGGGGGQGGAAGSAYNPVTDPYSLFNIENAIGARGLWSQYTGAGVDVALIDSGVAPVEGLTGATKLVNGPDLSEESQSASLAHLDTFGHGTHMAGIIAGRDPGTSGADDATNPNAFMGVAPDARIVSVKVADARGNTDVSQVIAGLDWVVQNAHDPGFDIRVVNLSYGTDSSESYLADPLTFAVEQAWLSGIVVVVSAGNGGASLGHLTDPAIDPYVIAVGADDYHGSTSTTDDTIPSFSGLGDGARSPDLVAPGVHVQSLRDPGSYVDQTYGATGLINYRFFRGSGTSQAAAVVSGSAALLIQEHPAWTPDQIKDALVDTATPLPGVSSEAQGAGLINLQAASEFTGPGSQTFPLAAGTGTLEGSRGGAHLVLNGVALQGEEDIFGQPVNTAALAAQEVAQAAWNGGTWNGSAWSASSWLLSSWLGPLWPSIPWSGDSWSGVAWAAEDYESGNWSGSSWSGSSWSGSSWSGSSWSGSSWSGSSWSGSSWSGSSWSGSSWSEASWSVASWS